MLKKLNLVLRNPVLSLTFKAVTLSLLLLLIVNHKWLLVIFIATAFYFYFSGVASSVAGGRQFLASFIALFAVSLLAVNLSDVSGQWSVVISLFFGVLFFLILGVKNLSFVNRRPIYHFLNNFLFLAVFIMFYASDKSRFFAVKYLAAFFGIYLLFYEVLTFIGRFEKENQAPFAASKLNLLSFGMAFSIFQLLWAVSLLPIGFLNAGALMLVFILIAKDLTFAHLNGNLSRTIILKNITLLMVSVLVIFSASKWAP